MYSVEKEFPKGFSSDSLRDKDQNPKLPVFTVEIWETVFNPGLWQIPHPLQTEVGPVSSFRRCISLWSKAVFQILPFFKPYPISFACPGPWPHVEGVSFVTSQKSLVTNLNLENQKLGRRDSPQEHHVTFHSTTPPPTREWKWAVPTVRALDTLWT